ncbi:MAG: biotin carboxylase N-terminal domain-containing protein, partial [Myxococcota bacterium]
MHRGAATLPRGFNDAFQVQVRVSAADAGAPYTKGRETVALGPARAAHSYLNLERIVEAARQRRCTAVPPGGGVVSVNPRFA